MENRISQIIKECATENFNLYPDNYLSSLEDSRKMVVSLAEQYFENRNEAEVARDEKACIELSDYIDWCVAAYCYWLSDKDEMREIKTV